MLKMDLCGIKGMEKACLKVLKVIVVIEKIDHISVHKLVSV